MRIFTLFVNLLLVVAIQILNAQGTDIYVDKEVMSKYIKNGFKTKRLIAVFSSKKDFDILADYFVADSEIMNKFYIGNGNLSLKNDFVKYLEENIKRKDSFYFTIKLKDSKIPIGQLNFKFFRDKILTISYWIGPKYRRKGYLKEIGFKFIEELLFKLKSVKYLEVYADVNNKPSISFVRKLSKYLNKRHGCTLSESMSNDNSLLFFYIKKP